MKHPHLDQQQQQRIVYYTQAIERLHIHYTTERLQTDPKNTKSKTFWIVFVVILVVTLSIAFTWCVCKKSYGERVITTTSIELDNLTGHSFDEEEDVEDEDEEEIEYEAMIKIKQS